jgi:hypothetical protein
MERCRSSEAILGSAGQGQAHRDRSRSRDGRKRDVKATSLLFRGLPSAEEIQSLEIGIAEDEKKKDEVEHVEEVVDEMMDVDEPLRNVEVDVVPAVWGMVKWGRETERREVRKGVRLIGMEEVRLGLLLSGAWRILC